MTFSVKYGTSKYNKKGNIIMKRFIPPAPTHDTSKNDTSLWKAYTSISDTMSYYTKVSQISTDLMRVLTRAFYNNIFDNKLSINKNTGLSTLESDSEESTDDHFATPQTIARIIILNWYSDFQGEEGYELFCKLYNFCRRTVKVTRKQNKVLSGYTINNENKGGEFYLRAGIVERYLKEDFVIMHRKAGEINTENFIKILNVPPYILEKEKDLIRRS